MICDECKGRKTVDGKVCPRCDGKGTLHDDESGFNFLTGEEVVDEYGDGCSEVFVPAKQVLLGAVEDVRTAVAGGRRTFTVFEVQYVLYVLDRSRAENARLEELIGLWRRKAAEDREQGLRP